MTLRCIDSSFWKFKSTIWFLMIYLLTIFFVFVMHVHQLLDVILPILKDLSDQKDVRHVLYEKYHMPEWFQQHGIPAPSWQHWKFFWLNSCFFFLLLFICFFILRKADHLAPEILMYIINLFLEHSEVSNAASWSQISFSIYTCRSLEFWFLVYMLEIFWKVPSIFWLIFFLFN